MVHQMDENIPEKSSSMPEVDQVMSNPDTFCSFCILESHIKGIFEAKKKGIMRVKPIGIYLLFNFIGNGQFFEID